MVRYWLLLMISMFCLVTLGCAGAEEEDLGSLDGNVRDVAPRLVVDSGVPALTDAGQRPMPGQDSGGGLDGSANMDAGEARPMGDQGCIELARCLSECQDAGCSLQCRNQAPPEATMLYDAIFSCGTQNGCNEPGGSYDTACMNDNCIFEMDSCYGPPPPGPPPPMGQGTCEELDECLRECDEGDLNCRDTCVVASSQLAFDQLTSMQTCFEEAQCIDGDIACLLTTCEGDIRACYGSVSVPRGAADCAGYNDCLNECIEGDEACFSACISATSPDGYNGFQALISCVRMAECPADDGDCQRAACGEEFEACFGPPTPPPMGVGDCYQLNLCLNECGEDDRACTDACIRNSSQMAYDLFITAIDCLRNSNCANDDAACREMACGMQVEACVGPAAMPSGVLTCGEFNNCLVACMQGDRRCVDSCINQASVEGYRRFEVAIDCIEAAGCPPNDADCQQLNCGAQISACINH